MKLEIDSDAKLSAWLGSPGPAVFQGMDLTKYESSFLALSLKDCVFLGCGMTEAITKHAATFQCLMVPPFPNLPFDAFERALYSPDDLYDQYDPADSANSYERCLDRRVYVSFIDPKTKKLIEVDADVTIARRIHDASIADALDDLLDLNRRKRSVAIMGGHDFPRDEALYKDIASFCIDLTRAGYFIVTGGGPGLMEAANLGAYCAGFADPGGKLEAALGEMRKAPKYDDQGWLATAYRAWKAMGKPDSFEGSRSLGIPTWFYGHEPPNVFATDIAKYFENSIREEGLLAIALAGVLFARGNAGTVQELFQDACQNYYSTYDGTKSPMILLDSSYWAPSTPLMHHYGDQRKPAFALLEKLASEKGFSDRIFITDSTLEAMKLIKRFSPIK